MRRKHLWILGALILLTAIVVLPLGLRAQSEDVAPPPPFPRPAVPEDGEDNIPYPEKVKPTNTPNTEEEKNLSKIEPPVFPTAEIVDTAPDDGGVKYEIIIRRGKDNRTVVLRVPIDIKPEDVVEKYIKRGEGDTYYVAPPPHAEPPEN